MLHYLYSAVNKYTHIRNACHPQPSLYFWVLHERNTTNWILLLMLTTIAVTTVSLGPPYLTFTALVVPQRWGFFNFYLRKMGFLYNWSDCNKRSSYYSVYSVWIQWDLMQPQLTTLYKISNKWFSLQVSQLLVSFLLTLTITTIEPTFTVADPAEEMIHSFQSHDWHRDLEDKTTVPKC